MAQDRVIAVVDDDDMVRSSVASLLRSLGLSARTFMSADEYLAAEDMGDIACLARLFGKFEC